MLGCAGGGGPPTKLTVMTYNIHHGGGMDDRVDLERIARVIRAANPDFVALQEVDRGATRTDGVDQPEVLARFARMHVVYGPAMPFQGGEYGDAVLSRWPIKSSRVVKLPWREGGQREPRVAVAATAEFPFKEGAIEFISTHWDHTKEPSDRLAQAQKVDEAWRNAGPATILAGDFNCAPGTPPLDTLGREWTLVTGTDPAQPTCCGNDLREKIDHIFVKPSKRWRVVEHHVVDEEMASDHRPVVVRLELRPK